MEARFVEFEAADGGDVRVNASEVQWIEKGTKDLTGDYALILRQGCPQQAPRASSLVLGVARAREGSQRLF